MGITNDDLIKKWPTGQALWAKIAQKSPEIALAFSCGKDSVCALIELKKSNIFKKITLFYQYIVPNLDFIEKSIAYYEDFFETKIHQLPHPSLYRMLNNLTFQAPENCKIIENCKLPNFDYFTLLREFKKDEKIKNETFCGTGVRSCDSIVRRLTLAKNGPINDKKYTFLPIWNYNKKQVYEVIEKAKCKLPIDYKIWGRSFDGIDYRFLGPMKQHFPDDYKKVLCFFPLAELEIKRIEYFKEYLKNG